MDDKVETGTREESDRNRRGETWAAIIKIHYTHISNI